MRFFGSFRHNLPGMAEFLVSAAISTCLHRAALKDVPEGLWDVKTIATSGIVCSRVTLP